MFVQERYKMILDCIQKNPQMSVDDLMAELGVSRSTLRRDLIDLERQGMLVRVHGGVVNADSLRGEPTFDRRHRDQPEEKQAIAKVAAEMVFPNQVVYLDAGTTALEVGRLLMYRSDLKLITHSIRLLSHAGLARCSVTCVGGEYRPVSDALVGGLTASWMDHLNVDIAFVGASGLSPAGASTTELSECAVKQAILKRAKKRVLVCDSSKWNSPAAIEFAPWGKFHMWVTDKQIPRAGVVSARLHEVNVVVAR